ncbi:hypothetical protein KI387_033358, partial [Taxus chinensis]
ILQEKEMGRHHVCCHKQKLKKGLWSLEEDEKLMRYITKYGHGRWSYVPNLAGRTDNEIKNFWNSCIKKKLKEKGIDPSTYKSISEVAGAYEDKSVDNQQASSKAEELGVNQDDRVRINPTVINSNALLDNEIFGLNSFSHKS